MIDEQEAFQDFLELTVQDFRLRYKPKFSSNKKFNTFTRKLREDPPLLDREVGKGNISHVRKFRAARDKDKFIRELEQTMRNRKVVEAGISQYVASLRQMTTKNLDELGFFQYKGEALNQSTFDKEEIELSKLAHRPNIRTQVLLEAVEALNIKYPGQTNTTILREYVENIGDTEVEEGSPEKGVDYFPDLAIGSFDLELTNRRREIYTYWEEVAPKFQKVIDASKAIITEYGSGKLDDYEELKDDMDRANRKSFYSRFEELVGSVENPNGDNNYVVKLEPVNLTVQDLNGGRIQNIIRIWFDQIEKIEIGGMEGRGVDYSKDKDEIIEETGWTDDAGLTEEEIKEYEALERQMARETKDELEGGKTLINTIILVDPLLFYLVENNRIELGAYSKEEIKIDVSIGIKRAIRRLKNILDEFDDESVVDELEEYIDKIKVRASDASQDKEYYLPYTQQVLNAIDSARGTNPKIRTVIPRKKILKLHKGFLIAVNNLIQPDLESDRTMHPKDQTAVTSGKKPPKKREKRGPDKTATTYPEPLGYTPGQRGKLREHTGKMKNLIKKLIKAIDEYYIDPSNSQYYPFNRDESDKHLFDEFETAQLKRTLEVHWDKPKKGNWKAMSVMARKFNRHKTDMVSYSQMQDVVNWLKKIKNYDGRNINNQIILPAQNAFDSLEDITGGYLTHENKVYFAYYIDLMARKNGNDISGIKFPKYGGVFISDLASQYDDNNEEYPMKALRKYLGSKKTMFTQRDSAQTPMGDDKKRIMNEYFDMTKVTKSAVENTILDAHDIIRKIGGKPTYFAFGDTSDFDDVNNTIDIIKKSHNVELMPVEIENIVDDFNSHETLSKKYGVSQEVIYRVKSMYR